MAPRATDIINKQTSKLTHSLDCVAVFCQIIAHCSFPFF
uniref:Uncharacterized protein n=1 Tax=Myoviridae sp. ct9Fw19 TaxID=2826624 RepID=A0A8S5MCN1_9CAUD|nr:MAG TPA: hypothetical protein [Myoviridae sp. ct9Fw19]